jgi:hypothetical protein
MASKAASKGDLSRRVGAIVGEHLVQPGERRAIIEAVEKADSWDDLPENILTLLEEIQGRPGPGDN